MARFIQTLEGARNDGEGDTGYSGLLHQRCLEHSTTFLNIFLFFQISPQESRLTCMFNIASRELSPICMCILDGYLSASVIIMARYIINIY